jgi:3'(2'), 5'-bisphosphate nucleotidase
MKDLVSLLPEITDLAHKAGDAIMEIYATDFEHTLKADKSPVTAADLAAEAVIEKRLAALTPEIPLVAEEAASAGRLPDITGDQFWLVDPLDGTREFLDRNDEFTVNIALVEAGRPVLGVVYAPALALTFTGIPGDGAARAAAGSAGAEIKVRPIPAGGLTLIASRRHGDAEAIGRLLGGHRVGDHKTAGSSLKFCLVAAGEADLYPRFGRTMEWDTAAGHAVLAAAGGRVTIANGSELSYGKPGLDNPHFVAWGALEPWPYES